LKREAKLHTIEEFYENASDIVRKVALNISDEETNKEIETDCGREGRFFKENGMLVHDVEVLSVTVEEDVEDIIDAHQKRMIEKSLELSNANKEIEVVTKLAEVDKTKADLEYNTKLYGLDLNNKLSKEKIKKDEEIKRIEEASELAAKTAEQKLQTLMDAIQKSELARQKAKTDAEIAHQKEIDNLEIVKQRAYTDAVKKVVDSISPDLIAAMVSTSNAELLSSVAESMSPYAMANGESVADVTNKLLRGTSLEGLVENLTVNE
jgi:hypothetical protein